MNHSYEQKHPIIVQSTFYVYMRRRDILIRIPPSYCHIVFIINIQDIQLTTNENSVGIHQNHVGICAGEPPPPLTEDTNAALRDS